MSIFELILRCIIIPLVIYCAVKTVNGPICFAKGHFCPPYYYMTFVFFSSVTTLSYELWHFLEPGDDLWRFMLLTLSVITGVVGVVGLRAGAPLMTERFRLVYKALPQALAIATLAEYDLAAADKMADNCWTLVKGRVQTGTTPENA